MPTAPAQREIQTLLERPLDQRAREYRYRMAQSLVFGAPVVFLQYFGHVLGPIDAERWVPVFQALLAGWVLYVNAGMIFEGIILLLHRGKLSADMIVSCAAALAYLFSLVATISILFIGRAWYGPMLFHVVVITLSAWSAIQWLRHRGPAQ